MDLRGPGAPTRTVACVARPGRSRERRPRPRRQRRARCGRPTPARSRTGVQGGVGEARPRDVPPGVPGRVLRPRRSSASAIEQMDPVEYLLVGLLRALGCTPSSTTACRAARSTRPRSTSAPQYFLENPDAPLPERRTRTCVEFIDAVDKAGRARRARHGQGREVRGRRPGHGHRRRARAATPARPATSAARPASSSCAHGDDDLPGQRRQRRRRGPRARLHGAVHQRGALGRRGRRAQRLVYFDVWEPYIVPATSRRTPHDRAPQSRPPRPRAPGPDRRPRQGRSKRS